MIGTSDSTAKLAAGRAFPITTVQKLGGGEIVLGQPRGGAEWQLVLVYRGKHCPLCTKYLAKLKELALDFKDEGIDVVIVSADPEEKAHIQTVDKLEMNVDVGISLSIDQMNSMGLYVSHPRSPEETDRPFAEPGVFVVNEKGNLHVVDISNNPFVRPDLQQLLNGLQWIRNPDNNYPIRGTHPDGLLYR